MYISRVPASAECWNPTLRTALFAGCGIASLMMSTFASAQVTTPTVAAAPDQAQTQTQTDSATDDIVVTAQKRSENVQNVPKAVTVITNAALAAQGVTTSRELANAIPSVTLADNSMNSKPPGIRGIVTFSTGVGVQTQTGIVVDDIAQPTFSTLYTELTDIERVEVFAGPQSTLSGRNAVGGLINFVTRAPSFKSEANVNLEQTTDGQTRGSVFLTGPINGKIAYSLSSYYNDWRGPTRNLYNLKNNDDPYTNGFEDVGVRAKVLANLTDTFSMTVTGYYLQSKRIGGPSIITSVAPGATSFLDGRNPPRTFEELYPGVKPSLSNRDGYSEEDSIARTKDRGITLRLDKELGSIGLLSSLTNYQQSNQPRRDVYVETPRTDVAFFVGGFNAYTDVNTKYFSQELRLVSPGGQRFTYLGGLIYTNSKLFQPYERLIFAFDSDRTFGISSLGVFGRGTYQVTAKDDVTFGARYQYDNMDYTWKFYQGPAGAYSENRNKYGFFAGEASYAHRFTDDINAYATIARSETGKSFDTEDYTTAAVGKLQPFRSEVVNSYQVGLKSQLFEKRLTFNVEVYRADYSNYQVQSVSAGTANSAPIIRLLSVGKVRVQGIDLTVAAKPSPSLSLGILANYNDAKIRDYPGAPCYTNQTEAQGCMPATALAPANQGNIAGNQLQNAPKLKLNANIEYYPTILPKSLGTNVGLIYRYQTNSRLDYLGDPVLVQGAYGILDGHIAIRPSDRYTLTFYINNILNKTYYTAINRPLGIDALSVNYGRDSFRYAGIRLNAKF